MAVSQAFIRAVAAGEPQACASLTEDAAEFAEVASGESSCEQAIRAGTAYRFFGTAQADLAEELEAGQLEETKTGAVYRFCTPTEVEVKLELEKAEDGWLIDLVQAGYSSTVTPGGRETRGSCDPAPRP